MKKKGIVIALCVLFVVFAAGCASTPAVEEPVAIPDGADTLSTETGSNAKEIRNLYYKTYHYEATKEPMNYAGAWGLNDSGKGDPKYKFASIKVQKFGKKHKGYQISRLITDEQTTVVYQCPKGAITEIYNNTGGDGFVSLTPDSNLASFRKNRQKEFKGIGG